MQMIFVDTAGLVSYLDSDDALHFQAKRIYQTASQFVTHSLVLAEFVAVCRSRRLNVGQAIQLVQEIIDEPIFEVIWVDYNLLNEGLRLLRARPDKTYSLCDAVSFVIMRLKGVREALTTDKHFEQEGFIRLLMP